jgi:hypothetical protein
MISALSSSFISALLRMFLVVAGLAERDKVSILQPKLRILVPVFDMMDFCPLSDPAVSFAVHAEILIPAEDMLTLLLPSCRIVELFECQSLSRLSASLRSS